MRKIFVLVLAALLFAVPVQAQQDSVNVEVIDRTDLNVLIDPAGPVKMFRGDSLQFTATAVDTISGDTLNVEFLWSSSNENVLTVDPETGMARFLSRGNAEVIVEVLRIVAIHTVGQADDGTWFVIDDTYTIRQNEWRPLCAYAEFNSGEIKLPDDPRFSHEWTFTASDESTQWDFVEFGPSVQFAEFTESMATPSMPECPAFENILPLLPMPQQIDFLLRQSQSTQVG